jgi:prolyl-tRNA synthetase
MYEAYQRIFARCGLTVLACEADPGMMGGDVSHEFMAPAESGEDRVVRCEGCGYAANLEAAKCPELPVTGYRLPEEPKPMEAVKTPGKHSVKAVSEFLTVPASKLIKTLIYDADKDHVAVLVRGDHDVNEAKLARLLGTPHVKLSSAATIERVSGSPVGFAGPVKLAGARLLADHAVMGVVNGVAGANQADTHLVNVNPGRDFQPGSVADVRIVTAEDACPACGGRLAFVTTIEVGHVFKLGVKYSQALGAVIQDAAGASTPMVMGCYGIGINRIIAVAVEQRHDANGIVWPPALAPFHALVSVLEADPARGGAAAGQAAYEALSKAGFEVLLDDREQSPGSKLKDADLVGIPVQVVVGKAWKSDRKFEVCLRATKERVQVPAELLVETVSKLLEKAS